MSLIKLNTLSKDDLKKENGHVYERLKSIEESIEGARDTADDTPILTDV